MYKQLKKYVFWAMDEHPIMTLVIAIIAPYLIVVPFAERQLVDDQTKLDTYSVIWDYANQNPDSFTASLIADNNLVKDAIERRHYREIRSVYKDDQIIREVTQKKSALLRYADQWPSDYESLKIRAIFKDGKLTKDEARSIIGRARRVGSLNE